MEWRIYIEGVIKKKLFFLISLLAFLFLLLVLGIFFLSPKTEEPIRLVWWGLFEEEEVILPLIREYQNLNPKVTIEYSRRDFTTLFQYRELLLSRLEGESAPDIFRLHQSWVPFFASKLAPSPKEVLGLEDYRKSFYPVVADWGVVNGKVYALALEYDSLVLLYNASLFREVGLNRPPQTWEEFRDYALTLRQLSPDKTRLLRAGAAVGEPSNVSHAADLLSLLFAQSGVDILASDFSRAVFSRPAAGDALLYFTSLSTTERVWDKTFENSIRAFALGKVGMMIVPSWRILEIKKLAADLDFSAAPVPQAPTTKKRVEWASFWMEAVSGNSAHPREAWRFLSWLSEKEQLTKLNQSAVLKRGLGSVSPRPDMAQLFLTDSFLAPVVAGAPFSLGGIFADAAGNDVFTGPLFEAIDQVLRSELGGEEALSSAEKKITRLLTGGEGF